MKQNYVEWYKTVDFIQDEMQFYSYKDFVEDCYAIKVLYNLMSRQEKKLYQWYVFSGFLSYNQKCIIWDFLNDYIGYKELVLNLSNKSLEQRTFNSL